MFGTLLGLAASSGECRVISRRTPSAPTRQPPSFLPAPCLPVLKPHILGKGTDVLWVVRQSLSLPLGARAYS